MYVLRLHCIDQPGIVAAVATTLSNNQCNIEESSQFNDTLSGRFFMRVVFSTANQNSLKGFNERFPDIADRFQMAWDLRGLETPIKTLILVSKADHCLNDILYRWRTKHLNIEITAIVSNHENNRKIVEDHGLRFEYLPVAPETKISHEEKLDKLIQETGADLIVLARYMQVLSPGFCTKHLGKIINIHHSFLPGFKGAKPYHQAWERGVKIIGATAHFVTPDLDDGPIIDQDVERIDHAAHPEKMQVVGKDIEARVLSRAILAYTEHRIFLHGNRTIIL